MGIDVRMAKAFGLEGDARQRHANPWSVYTRIPIPPLLVAAMWFLDRMAILYDDVVPTGSANVARR